MHNCLRLCIHHRLQQSHIWLWHWGWIFMAAAWLKDMALWSVQIVMNFNNIPTFENKICQDHNTRINGVDCTCTGSLLEWFPELTLGNLGPQRSHDDGSKVVASRFLLRSAAELMNFWSPPVTEWPFRFHNVDHLIFYFFNFQVEWLNHEDKLTWLVLGEDPAARSHRVEQFTALWGL